jgi:predicted Fe-Mo cluster-binding NifX family protein
MLASSGIKVISEISGPVEAVLDAYSQGTLLHSGFFMPGRKNNYISQEYGPED